MKKNLLIFIVLLCISSCSIDWNDEMKNKITTLENKIQSIQKDNEIQCLEQSRKTFEANTKWIDIKTFVSTYKNNICYMETSITNNGNIIDTLIDVYTNKTLAENSVGKDRWCFTPDKELIECSDPFYRVFRNSIFE